MSKEIICDGCGLKVSHDYDKGTDQLGYMVLRSYEIIIEDKAENTAPGARQILHTFRDLCESCRNKLLKTWDPFSWPRKA